MVSERVYPTKLMILQLYESELFHAKNYDSLVIVVMWTYEDTSMYQTDKGWVLIAILGFQFKI